MSKRKRDDGDDEATASQISAKQHRIQHKLNLGVTKLGHAFKLAKGFERQKLGRRRKTAVAQANQKDVERIDSEIEALKNLDTSKAAKQHLFKTLSKQKAVSEHPDLPPKINKPGKASSDPAALNVIARLCNSNQGKSALDTAVLDITHALGLEAEKSGSLKKKRKRAKDFDLQESEDAAKDRVPDRRPVREEPSKSRSRSPMSVGDDGEDDMGAYDERIASSEDGSADEFSDAEELEQRLMKETGRQRSSTSGKYDVEADLSLSDPEDVSESVSPEPQKSATAKKASFLPSLTMGGYISGSDSEADEVDVAPKKNRRGQRARQAINEKKYGANAKHLQKQKQTARYDPKRGAIDGSQRGQRGKTGRNGVAGGVGNAREAETRPAKMTRNPHRDDGGALHPSWEAAKKAKEKKQAPVAFEGRKITFD